MIGGIEKANEGDSCIEPPGVMLYHVQLPLLMWPLLWMAHATAVQHLACVHLPALCRGCVLVIPLRFSRGVDPHITKKPDEVVFKYTHRMSNGVL